MLRCLLDGERVFEADGKRLFHHDVNAVSGADLDHMPVVVGVGVYQHGLRMGFLQHFFEIRKQQGVIQAISSRGLREQARVGFGDTYDLNLGTMQ